MRRELPRSTAPDHVALTYGPWAPITDDGKGKIPDGQCARWYADMTSCAVSPDYADAYRRWESSFRAPADRTLELELESRLLVGHGNPSATDVGITVHHTWGVPVIPGSALKGLLSHHVDAVYGPDAPALAPWEQPEAERERARYQGVMWARRRIRRGPGDVYRLLFGAPDADEDDELREHGLAAGAQRGHVIFHDALYVPGSAPKDRPFAADVLTVHQKRYYNTAGKHPPNDYDGPNPVSFLSVRPGVRLLVALSGPLDWTALAERLLLEALASWGAGGKTSSGYGRLSRPTEPTAPTARPAVVPERAGPARPEVHRGRRPGDRITVTRVEAPNGKLKLVADDGTPGHFAGETPPPLAVDETIEVWIANVGQNSYTLTLRQDIAAKLAAPGSGSRRPHGAPAAGPPRGKRR